MAGRWDMLIEFEEAVGWVISGDAPGPAGTVSLLLDGARVTVDAVDPARLVEFVAFAGLRSDDICAAALTACRLLLGAEAAEAVAARPEAAGAVRGAPGPLWPAVEATARAQFLYAHDTTAPRLAALRLVFAGYGLAPAGAGELLRKHAWEALPAVLALGRSAARDAAFLDRLPAGHRADLAAALAMLEEVLVADQWDRADGEPLGALTALLTQVTDEHLAALGRGPEEDSGDQGLPPHPIPLFASDTTELAVTEVDWSASSRQLRARLGDLAAEAFAGAFATGQLPGAVSVQLPFRVGTRIATGEIVVRVQDWTGAVLGEAPLRVSGPPGGLPRGRCRIEVAPSAAGLAEALDAGQGVHIDIAVAALPRLDAAGLRGVARRRGRQHGVDALLARQAGATREEAAHWESSARFFVISGDKDRATAARTLAADATARATVPGGPPGSRPFKPESPQPESPQPESPQPGTPWSDGPDWAQSLLLSWLRAAGRLVAGTAAAGQAGQADRIERLRLLVADLADGAGGASELASASQLLAEAYLESGTGGAAALALLRNALRIRYARADETAAALTARAIAAAAGAVAEVDPGNGDDE